MTTPTSQGQAAYVGYFKSAGGRSLHDGSLLPGWDGLKPDIKRAWEDAGEAAIAYNKGLEGTDPEGK